MSGLNGAIKELGLILGNDCYDQDINRAEDIVRILEHCSKGIRHELIKYVLLTWNSKEVVLNSEKIISCGDNFCGTYTLDEDTYRRDLPRWESFLSFHIYGWIHCGLSVEEVTGGVVSLLFEKYSEHEDRVVVMMYISESELCPYTPKGLG